MKGSFYQLLSFLPSLDFNRSPRITLDSFEKNCELPCTESQLSMVRKVLNEDSPPEFPGLHRFSSYSRWELGLRNEGVRLRGVKLDINEKDYLQDEPKGRMAFRFLKGLNKDEDPLVRENLFDQARWQLICDLEIGGYFSFENLLFYGVKLKILDRKFRYDQGKGRVKFENLTKQLLNEVRLQLYI